MGGSTFLVSRPDLPIADGSRDHRIRPEGLDEVGTTRRVYHAVKYPVSAFGHDSSAEDVWYYGDMAATRKVTFTLPIGLAEQLARQVRSQDRSAFVAEAIANRMDARRKRLIAACEIANASPTDAELAREMDSLPDTLAHDPWPTPEDERG